MNKFIKAIKIIPLFFIISLFGCGNSDNKQSDDKKKDVKTDAQRNTNQHSGTDNQPQGKEDKKDDFEKTISGLDIEGSYDTDDFVFVPHKLSDQSGVGWIKKYNYRIQDKKECTNPYLCHIFIYLEADAEALKAYDTYKQENGLSDQYARKIFLPKDQSLCEPIGELKELIAKMKTTDRPLIISKSDPSLSRLCKFKISFKPHQQEDVFNVVYDTDIHLILKTHINLPKIVELKK